VTAKDGVHTVCGDTGQLRAVRSWAESGTAVDCWVADPCFTDKRHSARPPSRQQWDARYSVVFLRATERTQHAQVSIAFFPQDHRQRSATICRLLALQAAAQVYIAAVQTKHVKPNVSFRGQTFPSQSGVQPWCETGVVNPKKHGLLRDRTIERMTKASCWSEPSTQISKPELP
jgi:hypothetical protein